MNNRPHCSRTAAFTLVELMVVIATLATLLSILLPLCGKALASSRQSACMQSLRGASLTAMREQAEEPSPVAGILAPPPGSSGGDDYVPPSPGCPYCNPPWAPGKKRPGPAPAPSPAEPEWMGRINREALCPEAPRNPAAALDPKSQPLRHSYGLFKDYLQDTPHGLHWVLADADVSLITTRTEISFNRHRGVANVGRVDGSVMALSHADSLGPAAR